MLIAGILFFCAANHKLYTALSVEKIPSQATGGTGTRDWMACKFGTFIFHAWPLSSIATWFTIAGRIYEPGNVPCSVEKTVRPRSQFRQASIGPQHLDGGSLPSVLAQGMGGSVFFSGSAEEQGAEMRHFPLTRAHCQPLLESSWSKDWSTALINCKTDKRCGVVTMNRRTGETHYCKAGTFKQLRFEWDSAISETILGVLPVGINSTPFESMPLPWVGTCQQCTEKLYEVSTTNGCKCAECSGGQCPMLDLLAPWSRSKSHLLPASSTLSLPLSRKLNFSNKASFFNPSVSILGKAGVIAYRLSDDSKCKGLSHAGNFVSDPLPFDGSRAKFSSRVQVCLFHPVNFRTEPKQCKVVEVPLQSIRNKGSLNLSKEVSLDLEDPRTFVANKQLYFIANTGFTGEREGRTMILVQLDSELRFLDATLLWRSWNTTNAPTIEKNWGPLVREGKIYMVYSICPFVACLVSLDDGKCELRITRSCPEGLLPSSSIHFKGSSPWIEMPDGYLGVVHSSFEGAYGRVYAHRFVSLSLGPMLQFSRVSDAFSLPAPTTKHSSTFQYVSGLEVSDGYVFLLYGIADCQSAVLELPLTSVFAKWLHSSVQEKPTIWWHASCNNHGSPFCAGQFQLPRLKDALKHKAAVQLYVPNIESMEETVKHVPAHFSSANEIQSYGPSDVIVLHGQVNNLPVAKKNVVVALGWPFHAIPQYMIQMAHDAKEVWVESMDEADILMEKGVLEDKVKRIPLSILGLTKCSKKGNAVALSNLHKRYPILSKSWNLQLIYVGSTDTVDGLAPMLSSYCSTFTGKERILLVLLLSIEDISHLQTCKAHHHRTTSSRAKSPPPPATLLVAESGWHQDLSVWINQADMVVYPSLLFSYSLAVLQALSCAKPLVLLWNHRAASFLPGGRAHFVPSEALQVKCVSAASMMTNASLRLTTDFSCRAEAILPKWHILAKFARMKLLDQQELSHLQFVAARSGSFSKTLRDIFEKATNKSTDSSAYTFKLEPAQDAAFQILVKRLDPLLVTDPFVLKY